MNLRTEIHPDSPLHCLRPGDGVVFQGSCFATHMAEKMRQHGFGTISNSHGILFHPVAIARALSEVLEIKEYKETDLMRRDDTWLSLNHHGSFSGPECGQVLKKINDSIHSCHQTLRSSRMLVITLGTSWAWEWKESGVVVANCHKIPASHFRRALIPSGESVLSLERALRAIRESLPDLQVVLTVSPVRHWREGAVQNQLSKAHLIVACHELSRRLNGVHYFPAYELFMDDLRDYRFYAQDMIHPSELGIDYTWAKFFNWVTEPDFAESARQIARLNRIYTHRPLNLQEGGYERAIKNAEEQISQLLGQSARR